METQEESKVVETNSKNDNTVQETTEKEDHFDYKKAREERITRSTERRILKELGEDSFESIKGKLQEALNIKAELEKERINGQKLKILESGFDNKYLDFIVYEINKTRGHLHNWQIHLRFTANRPWQETLKPVRWPT